MFEILDECKSFGMSCGDHAPVDVSTRRSQTPPEELQPCRLQSEHDKQDSGQLGDRIGLF
jgi:hypothetical protein